MCFIIFCFNLLDLHEARTEHLRVTLLLLLAVHQRVEDLLGHRCDSLEERDLLAQQVSKVRLILTLKMVGPL